MNVTLDPLLSAEQVHELQTLTYRMKKTLDSILEHMQSESQLHRQQRPAEALSVRLVGHNLGVNDFLIPLASRPKTFKLLAAFFSETDRMLSKEALIEKVYRPRSEVSERMASSNESNLAKLISRTRKLIVDTLETASWARHLEWLVFDNHERIWKLFLLRGEPVHGDFDPDETVFSLS